MALLSNYIAAAGGSNIQFASVSLTATSNTNSPTFPNTDFTKIPFNAKYVDTDNFCTLNNSLSTFTLPAGLYQLHFTVPLGADGTNSTIAKYRVTRDDTTVIKWPGNNTVQSSTGGAPGENSLTPAGLYLPTTASLALELRLSVTDPFVPLYNDGDIENYFRVDIWKLR